MTAYVLSLTRPLGPIRELPSRRFPKLIFDVIVDEAKYEVYLPLS